jgi:hypothetical protein
MLAKLFRRDGPMTSIAGVVALSLGLRKGGVFMKRLVIALALPLLLTAGAARADRPLAGGLGVDSVVSPGDVKATPEMWFYDQSMRQYKDPKMAVRAKAEFRSEQRQRRLETMRWFGFSNSRPRASSDPFHGDYSPGWVSNPGYYPSRWNGVGSY